MFKVTGYLTDGVPKPIRRRVLYRGCMPVGRRGMSWTNERLVAERFTDYWVEHGYGATNPGHVYEAVVEPNYVLATIRSTLETLNFNGTDHEIPAHSEWEFIVDARVLSITLVETARERIARVEHEEARLRTVRNAQGTPQGRLNRPTMSKAIELWPCRYDAPCRVKHRRSKTTTIARSVDAGGRPERQYELCSIDAEQVVERERAKGRGDRETGSRVEQQRRVMIGGRKRAQRCGCRQHPAFSPRRSQKRNFRVLPLGPPAFAGFASQKGAK